MKQTAQATYKYLLIGLVVVSALGIGVLGIGWYFVLGTASDNNKTITETNNLYHVSAKLGEISYSLKKVSSFENLLLETIPKSKEVSTFTADMDAVTKANRLFISGITVGNAQTKNIKTGEFTQSISKNEYYEIPIKYMIDGNYADFTNLINTMTTLRRLNKVTDVSVTADLSDKANPSKVKGQFVVTIYAKK
jgi:Tfp pilus assembly protein PilO